MVDRVNLFFKLRRYIKWVAERWFILAFCLVAGVGYSTYKAINTPDMFRARAQIGVAPRIQTPHSSQAQYQEEVSTFFDKQVQYMMSEHVLSRAWQESQDHIKKKEGFTYSPHASKGSASLQMQVDSTDFEFAKQFVTVWARDFLEYKEEMRRGVSVKTAAEVRKEIELQETKLNAAREKTDDFQRKNGIASAREAGDAAQARYDSLVNRQQDLKIARQQLENQKPEDMAASGMLQASTSTSAPSTTNSVPNATNTLTDAMRTSDPLALVGSRYGDLKIHLGALEAERDQRATTLLPRHPYLQLLEKEIANTRASMREIVAHIEELRLARIAALKRDEDSLDPIILAAKQEAMNSKGVQNEYQRLKEDETNLKSNLDDLKRQLQAIEAMPSEEGYFNIDDPGSGSPSPVSPDRKKMILSGLLFGAVFGLGLIYLLGRLDDRLELAEDIEAELQERMLGQIPLVNTRQAPDKKLLVSRLEKHDMFAESLRGVRSAIMFSGEDKQVLIVSSAAPGDGKTTITTNLAMTLALAGNRVLLLDGDLRRGNIHAYFEWEREPGLSEVLAGEMHWKKAVHVTEIKNFHVIPTGKLPPNPGELLITPLTKTIVKEARALYDYIIFDCPPLTSIDDAFSLSGLGDGVLFVIMSGQTSMRFAKHALTAVRQRGGKVLGLILNGIRPDNPYYYYQKYYYTYYTLEEPDAQGKPPSATGEVVRTKTSRRRRLLRQRERQKRSDSSSTDADGASPVSGSSTPGGSKPENPGESESTAAPAALAGNEPATTVAPAGPSAEESDSGTETTAR